MNQDRSHAQVQRSETAISYREELWFLICRSCVADYSPQDYVWKGSRISLGVELSNAQSNLQVVRLNRTLHPSPVIRKDIGSCNKPPQQVRLQARSRYHAHPLLLCSATNSRISPVANWGGPPYRNRHEGSSETRSMIFWRMTVASSNCAGKRSTLESK
jgi:hypothetical protein